jgi:hypothetical protein
LPGGTWCQCGAASPHSKACGARYIPGGSYGP